MTIPKASESCGSGTLQAENDMGGFGFAQDSGDLGVARWEL
ncbi:MAG: hypothetical protein AAFQ79_08670 [Pseudomonadota bacterium]